MKVLLISIIAVISSVYGYKFIEDFIRANPTCQLELFSATENLIECIKPDRFNGRTIQREAYANVIQYSGDENALREFSEKYCNIGYEVTKCFPIYFNISTSCQPIDSELAHKMDRTLIRTLDFMCENNAEAFVQMIVNDGIKIFMDNIEKAAECAEGMNNAAKLLVDQNDSEHLTAFCDEVKLTLSCHINWMTTHGNTHLINFINGTYTISAEELGC